jgi:lysophospholipase L1-like esterase
LNVPVLDLWTALEGNSENRALYLLDGLHLNDR